MFNTFKVQNLSLTQFISNVRCLIQRLEVLITEDFKFFSICNKGLQLHHVGTPLSVWSSKLSNTKSGQCLNGWQLANTRCCIKYQSNQWSAVRQRLVVCLFLFNLISFVCLSEGAAKICFLMWSEAWGYTSCSIFPIIFVWSGVKAKVNLDVCNRGSWKLENFWKICLGKNDNACLVYCKDESTDSPMSVTPTRHFPIIECQINDFPTEPFIFLYLFFSLHSLLQVLYLVWKCGDINKTYHSWMRVIFFTCWLASIQKQRESVQIIINLSKVINPVIVWICWCLDQSTNLNPTPLLPFLCKTTQLFTLEVRGKFMFRLNVRFNG